MIGRSDVARVALSHLNEGKRPEWYGQWCGQFALFVLHEAGLALGIEWQMGRGFVLQNPDSFLPVKVPRVGDIGIRRRNVQGKDVWHHVIVVARAGDAIHYVGGNQGPSPGIVGTGECSVVTPGWQWYSIEPELAVS